MGLASGAAGIVRVEVTIPPSYMISYKKKHEELTVSAPTKDEAKALFEQEAAKVGLLPAP